jgi:hypothetical protein
MAIVVTSWLTDAGFSPSCARDWGRNLILLMPVVVFVIGYGVRCARRGRTGRVVTQSSPPSEMTPAECGVLLATRMDALALTATLIDLSLKGF